MFEKKVDAIDLNFGCPQKIAKKGNFGAFIIHEKDGFEKIEKMVSKICSTLEIPVCAKIRILPEIEDTLKYAKMLENCGIKM